MSIQAETVVAARPRFGRFLVVAGAITAAGVLGALAAFTGLASAIVALCVILWFTLWRVTDALKRERAAQIGRLEQMRSNYESIIAMLTGALGLRDSVTGGHAQKMSHLASVVAWQMGMRKEQVRLVEQAAILHDVGKTKVAEAVMSKPGPLSDEEREEMRRHSALGHEILSEISFLRDVAGIVHTHHERFDGSGYPRGLSGERIPLAARIFAVVDTYEAMISHRPYRRVSTHAEAVEEIVRNSGTQFDPEVVKAFLEAERRGLIAGNPTADGNGATEAETKNEEKGDERRRSRGRAGSRVR